VNIFDASTALARIEEWFFRSAFATTDSTDGRRRIVIYRGDVVGSARSAVKALEVVARGCGDGRVFHDDGICRKDADEVLCLTLFGSRIVCPKGTC
jgi:hypothetical protein